MVESDRGDVLRGLHRRNRSEWSHHRRAAVGVSLTDYVEVGSEHQCRTWVAKKHCLSKLQGTITLVRRPMPNARSPPPPPQIFVCHRGPGSNKKQPSGSDKKHDAPK